MAVVIDGDGTITGATVNWINLGTDSIVEGDIATDAVTTTELKDNAVTTAKLADDAVTGNKLSITLAKGDVLYASDANTLNKVPKGTEGQVLTMGADNVPEWKTSSTSGGAWNLIGTDVASNSASLTITGLDSTYGQYAIGLSDFTSSGDNQYLEMQVGDSSGIHSGGSDYEHMSMVPVPTNNSGGYFSSSGNSAMRLLQNTGSSAGEGSGGLIYLNRPANGTSYPHFAGSVSSVNRHGNCAGGTFAGIRKAAVAVDRILVKFDSGNIVTGRMTIWGIAHT